MILSRFSMASYLLLLALLLSCTKTEEEPPVITPTVSIEDLTVEEGDAEKSIFVRLQMSTSASQSVTAYLQSFDGSAKAGEDYQSVDMAPVVFAPGSRLQEFKIVILGDEDYEPDETFKIRIESVEGANAGVSEASITLLNDDAGSSEIIIPTTGYSTPTTYPNMTMIWQDEFSGAEMDPNFWTFEIGTGNNGWGNNESQYYRKENTTLYEGHLVIEAREEVFAGRSYTSSRIITKDKFDFQYGRVDIRAVLPYGRGIWPALWMLGSNFSTVGWPSCGEIDIMELIGHQPATLYGTAHWSNSAGQHTHIGGNTTLNSGIFNDEFHVFSIIWNENQIRWLLDDQVFYVLDITLADRTEFHQNFFFIFNIAVGGNWPGYPDTTTTFPQRMIVDYVRVFQEI